jgi:hypothetical protein
MDEIDGHGDGIPVSDVFLTPAKLAHIEKQKMKIARMEEEIKLEEAQEKKPMTID